nr:MAG TPA: hypothetical protein [Caudoviricetes sp.]
MICGQSETFFLHISSVSLWYQHRPQIKGRTSRQTASVSALPYRRKK